MKNLKEWDSFTHLIVWMLIANVSFWLGVYIESCDPPKYSHRAEMFIVDEPKDANELKPWMSYHEAFYHLQHRIQDLEYVD